MILYFSGTGNTRLVAQGLAALLGDKAVEMDVHADAHTALGVGDGERVVWCFPIYSWGVPPVVRRYIAQLDLAGGDRAQHWMACTCGDDCGNADRQWRHLMEKRGWPVRRAYSVQMPNTYVLMKGFNTDPADVAAAKLKAAPAAIGAIADAIAADRPGNYTRGSWAWVKTSVIYPWFCRFDMSPKPFRTNSGCTSCGLCSRVCPTGNIGTDAEGRPVWGADCALCLRCYHSCPRRAIRYGRATEGKGMYLAPKELN